MNPTVPVSSQSTASVPLYSSNLPYYCTVPGFRRYTVWVHPTILFATVWLIMAIIVRLFSPHTLQLHRPSTPLYYRVPKNVPVLTEHNSRGKPVVLNVIFGSRSSMLYAAAIKLVWRLERVPESYRLICRCCRFPKKNGVAVRAKLKQIRSIFLTFFYMFHSALTPESAPKVLRSSEMTSLFYNTTREVK